MPWDSLKHYQNHLKAEQAIREMYWQQPNVVNFDFNWKVFALKPSKEEDGLVIYQVAIWKLLQKKTSNDPSYLL